MTGDRNADEWEIDRLDLDAYLRRIGQEAGPPDSATLDRLHRAHVRTIPFENLDVVLGRSVHTDLAAVQDKLVDRGRGGYCYEHTVLFGAVLERLGYGVGRLLARIGDDPVRPRPRTHMALHVTAEDAADPSGTSGGASEWLADVGFGAGSLGPVPWPDGPPAREGGWTYRVTRKLMTDDRGTFRLERADSVGSPGDWSTLHSFTAERQHASDVQMSHHFTATHPSSPFVGRVIAMQRQEGGLTRVFGNRLEVSRPDGPVETRDLAPDEVVDLLTDRFGIRLDEGDRKALLARLVGQSSRGLLT